MKDLIDTTEMYLRTIFELEEEGVPPMRARIAERLGHSGPTVSQTIARMERDGLVSVGEDRQLTLSESGHALATRVMRKHRLAERLLVDVIGLEWEYVHDEACRWEHVMSDRVERKIVKLLEEHRESPYGTPIPGLDELVGEDAGDDFRGGLVSLTQAVKAQAAQPAGDAGDDTPEPAYVVRRIGEQVQVDSEALSLLKGAWLRPGQFVVVRADDDRVVVVREGAQESEGVSLPRDIAGHVFVEPVTRT